MVKQIMGSGGKNPAGTGALIPGEEKGSRRRRAGVRFSGDDGEIRIANPEEAGLIRSYREAREGLERWRDREEGLRGRLISAIGASAGLDSESGRVSYRLARGRLGIDLERLWREYPEAAERCEKRGEPRRVLRFAFAGSGDGEDFGPGGLALTAGAGNRRSRSEGNPSRHARDRKI
ncbi:MAG: hypothetical protein LBU64_02410 [Planctomycetota bacterium]|nr:hypothetical protein [Planctomycetota bacterium]